MNKYVLIGIGVVVLGAVAIWQQDAQVLVLNADSQNANAQPNHHARTTAAGGLPLELQQLNTFKGAQVDGYLRTDHRGQLIVDINLRRWIDFHLSAQGELTLDDIVAYMQQQMQQLPQPGRDQALAILDSYLAYLNDLAEYDAEAARRIIDANLDDLEIRLAWQQRLRRQYLEPQVVIAFFGEDEALDQHTLLVRRLKRDGASAEDIAALEQQLPDDIQQARKESRLLISHAQNEEALKAQGASTQKIHQWRIQQYGVEAADRLAKLDIEQNAWQNKLKALQQFQNSLSNLSDSERETQLQTYLDKHFSENEQKRLPAALSLLVD